MHVDQPLRARTLVQIVDILRDQQQIARPFGVQPRQRAMGRIRLDRPELRPPRIVERMDQLGIAREGLRRGDVLDPVALP